MDEQPLWQQICTTDDNTVLMRFAFRNIIRNRWNVCCRLFLMKACCSGFHQVYMSNRW